MKMKFITFTKENTHLNKSLPNKLELVNGLEIFFFLSELSDKLLFSLLSFNKDS